MQRRDFLRHSSALSAASIAAGAASTTLGQEETATDQPTEADDRRVDKKRTEFKLKYAPHFGMFTNLAGKDPIDQLKFAADVGFTAWEDNGMKGKPPEL
ncbi:MAG: xylose isomerase, partial [Planctomycetota bacterium]